MQRSAWDAGARRLCFAQARCFTTLSSSLLRGAIVRRNLHTSQSLVQFYNHGKNRLQPRPVFRSSQPSSFWRFIASQQQAPSSQTEQETRQSQNNIFSTANINFGSYQINKNNQEKEQQKEKSHIKLEQTKEKAKEKETEKAKEKERLQKIPSPPPKHKWLASACFPMLLGLDYLAEYNAVDYHLNEAVGKFRKSLSWKQKLYGMEHPSVMNTWARMGELMILQGKTEDAKEIYEKILAILFHNYGTRKHFLVGVADAQLGRISEMSGDWARAENYFLTAIEDFSGYLKKEPRDEEEKEFLEKVTEKYYECKTSLAVVYDNWGKYKEADEVNKDVFFNRPDVNRPDHPLFLTHLHPSKSILNLPILDLTKPNMTVEEEMSIRWKEAKPLLSRNRIELAYQRAIDAQSRNLGEFHQGLSLGLHYMAHIYTENHKFEEAEKILKKLLSIKLREQGPASVPVANVYALMGNLCVRREDYAEAHRLYKKALSIKKALLGKEHFQVGLLHIDLAGTQQFLGGDFSESLVQLRRAYVNIGLTLPDIDNDTPKEVEEKVKAHRWFKRLDEMRQYFAFAHENTLQRIIDEFSKEKNEGKNLGLPEEVRKALANTEDGLSLVEYAAQRRRQQKPLLEQQAMESLGRK